MARESGADRSLRASRARKPLPPRRSCTASASAGPCRGHRWGTTRRGGPLEILTGSSSRRRVSRRAGALLRSGTELACLVCGALDLLGALGAGPLPRGSRVACVGAGQTGGGADEGVDVVERPHRDGVQPAGLGQLAAIEEVSDGPPSDAELEGEVTLAQDAAGVVLAAARGRGGDLLCHVPDPCFATGSWATTASTSPNESAC